MSEPFVVMLEGDTNTLGRTDEVTEIVLANPERIEEVWDLYFQEDEWVRMRASSVFKRLWRAEPELVVPYIDGFLTQVAALDQASANWTIGYLCRELDDHLTTEQRDRGREILKGYLVDNPDWIVQNATIETLSTWAMTDEVLSDWLVPILEERTHSHLKSVANKSRKWLSKLTT